MNNRLKEITQILKKHNIKDDFFLYDLIKYELEDFIYQINHYNTQFKIEKRINYIIELFTGVEVDSNIELDMNKMNITLPPEAKIKISYSAILNEERKKKLKNINKNYEN